MNKLNDQLRRLYQDAPDGQTRCIGLSFRRLPDDGEEGHWERLCETANALQSELGWPAPAVSISGAGTYGLWLSLEKPVPVAQARELRELLSAAFCAGAAEAPPALPPCQDQASGKWAAFIHPGMGASFAGDEGLEMQPPEAGQVALLEGLEPIGPALFAQALNRLRPQGREPEGVLLKDATLQQIVDYLHSKNIEPTFRFLK
jgi:hypothetical protein